MTIYIYIIDFDLKYIVFSFQIVLFVFIKGCSFGIVSVSYWSWGLQLAVQSEEV